MAVSETGPSSSYSDPIYDRLDTVAQRLARRWPIVVVAVLAIVVLALVLRAITGESRDTASVQAYLRATEAPDDTQKAERLAGVAQDEKVQPLFRARAHIDLVQIALDKKDNAGAKQHADAAAEQARASEDPGIQFEARLAQAAVAEDGNDLPAALKAYQDVETRAAATQPALKLAATLGAARTLQKQGDLDGALARLETVIGNTSAEARPMVEYGRWLYWQIKRQQAGAPDALVTPAKPDAADAAKPAADAAAPAGDAAKPADAAPADAAKPADAKPAGAAPIGPPSPADAKPADADKH